jgi:hypothetical protein
LSVNIETDKTQKRQDFRAWGLGILLKEKRNGRPYFPKDRLLDSVPA